MNITPINHQTGMVKNNSITFNSVVKQFGQKTGKEVIEKTVLPAGATFAAIAGVKHVSENNINNKNDKTEDGYTDILDANGKLIRKERYYKEFIDTDPKSSTGNSNYNNYVTRKDFIEYHDNGKIKLESYKDGYVLREFDENGNVIMLKEGSSPSLRYDENGNPIKPYPSFNVEEFEKRIDYLIDLFNREAKANLIKK